MRDACYLRTFHNPATDSDGRDPPRVRYKEGPNHGHDVEWVPKFDVTNSGGPGPCAAAGGFPQRAFTRNSTRIGYALLVGMGRKSVNLDMGHPGFWGQKPRGEGLATK